VYFLFHVLFHQRLFVKAGINEFLLEVPFCNTPARRYTALPTAYFIQLSLSVLFTIACNYYSAYVPWTPSEREFDSHITFMLFNVSDLW